MLARPTLYACTAAVLLVAGGGAAGFWLQRDGVAGRIDADAGTAKADVEDGADDLVRQDQPLYYSFNGPFTVNVKESDALIQASVSVSTHYATSVDNVKMDEPALRSAIVLALSNASEASAATDAGKQQLEASMATAINQQLKADGYTPTIDGAYFSDFVIEGDDE